MRSLPSWRRGRRSPTCCAAPESLESGVAKDRTYGGAVAHPQLFGGGLIAARRARGNSAHPVRRAEVALQCRQYRAEGRRIDPVARPLELNALEALRRLVH